MDQQVDQGSQVADSIITLLSNMLRTFSNSSSEERIHSPHSLTMRMISSVVDSDSVTLEEWAWEWEANPSRKPEEDNSSNKEETSSDSLSLVDSEVSAVAWAALVD